MSVQGPGWLASSTKNGIFASSAYMATPYSISRQRKICWGTHEATSTCRLGALPFPASAICQSNFLETKSKPVMFFTAECLRIVCQTTIEGRDTLRCKHLMGCRALALRLRGVREGTTGPSMLSRMGPGLARPSALSAAPQKAKTQLSIGSQ